MYDRPRVVALRDSLSAVVSSHRAVVDDGRLKTIFVALYSEEPDHVERVGTFDSLYQGKAACNAHFGRWHPRWPTWEDERHGSTATDDRSLYVVRELQIRGYV
jgi:hypothetical protein